MTNSSAPTNNSERFKIDRQRLLQIEKLANEVLIEQENLRHMDEQRQQNREALGVLRRKEVKSKDVWMQLGQEQYLKIT